MERGEAYAAAKGRELRDLLAETKRIRDRIATWPDGDIRTTRLAAMARDIARLEALIGDAA